VDTSALLVIDAQKIYTTKDSELYCKDSLNTIKRINSLIDLYQELRLPIIFIRHIHNNDGSDLGRMFDFSGEAYDDFNFKSGSEEVEYAPDLHRPQRLQEIIKTRYSAFVGTDLENSLKKKKVTTVTICGFMTNFCCDSTARDAHDRDFFVDFIADATGTPGTERLGEQEIRKIVAELLGAGYARIHSTKKYLSVWKRQG
jgi:ureidoacrylate peracid hydrolase